MVLCDYSYRFDEPFRIHGIEYASISYKGDRYTLDASAQIFGPELLRTEAEEPNITLSWTTYVETDAFF